MDWYPNIGDKYYTPCFSKPRMYDINYWKESLPNRWHYLNSMVFKTKEEAINSTKKLRERFDGERGRR